VNVIQLIALAALLVLGLIGACALIASEDREREPDLDSCSPEKRAERLQRRQEAAAQQMKEAGIKPITTREWVSSAHDAPTLQRKAPVLQLHRKGAR
jgi:hypothetical protein